MLRCGLGRCLDFDGDRRSRLRRRDGTQTVRRYVVDESWCARRNSLGRLSEDLVELAHHASNCLQFFRSSFNAVDSIEGC